MGLSLFILQSSDTGNSGDPMYAMMKSVPGGNMSVSFERIGNSGLATRRSSQSSYLLAKLSLLVIVVAFRSHILRKNISGISHPCCAFFTFSMG